MKRVHSKKEFELNTHEKKLVLQDRIRFAVEQYVRRTGQSPENTKLVVYRWLNTPEYRSLRNRMRMRKPHRA